MQPPNPAAVVHIGAESRGSGFGVNVMPSHHLGIYGATLHIATTRSELKTLRRRFELEKPESIGASYLVVDTKANNAPHLIVWIDRTRLDGPELVDTIAHEAVHTAAQLLDHIGQAADRHDSEALAYLTGWVAARLWEAS